MLRIMRFAFKDGITEADIYEVLPDQKSSTLGKRIENIWLRVRKEKTIYSLHSSLVRMFGVKFMLLGLCKLFEELLLVIIMPMSIGKIVMYFEKDQTTVSTTQLYLFSSLVVMTLYLNAFISHASIFHLLQITMKMRIACSSLIYRKALRLSRNSIEKMNIGHIITLLTNDVGKFEQGFFLSHFLWIAPIQTCLATYLIYNQIGYSALIGILFLILLVPIQMLLGQRTSVIRQRIAVRTDERVRIMNELLVGIQAIKMYCWEKPYAKFVDTARRKEMSAVGLHSCLMGLLYSFEFFVTRTSVFISLVVFVLTGNKLAPEKIFVVTAIYSVIKPAVTIVFATSIASTLGVHVSLKRIETFLNEEEFSLESKHYTENKLIKANTKIDIEETNSWGGINPRIIMKDVSAKWLHDNDELTLNLLNVRISPGQLVAIIGPVGSGKTSLLNLILKQMIVTEGEVDIQGQVSYASQDPWLFPGSIKQNILFGETFDENRYESVTSICALTSDFELLPHGDETLVGEKGRTLSGGQKSRINLARCIYRMADIYLMDDPFSAVDTKVGKHLYHKCIENFLNDKICILVTYQLQYLKNAEKIVLMKEGKIEGMGNFEELQGKGLDFMKMIEKIEAEIEGKESQYAVSTNEQKTEDIPHFGRENDSEGIVNMKTYWRYIRAGGNIFFIFILVMLIIIAHGTAFGGDYFVAYWVNVEQIKIVQPRLVYPETIERKLIIIIYAGLILSTLISAICFCLYYAKFFAKASSQIHNDMFNCVILAPMSFFNRNTVGRILNRFSKDLFLVDEHIPIVLLEVILIGCFVLGIFLLSAIIEPWFILPIFILFFGIYLFRRFYIKTSRSIKRLESAARSPILIHMTSSIEGLTTIRCSSMEKKMINVFDNLQDNHSSSWFLFLASNRCFGFWLDIFCFTFVAIAIFFMLHYKSDAEGGNLGLVITQYLGLIGYLQWGMRQWSELENQMVSVERLLEYSKMETEPKRLEKYELPSNWPRGGKIEFENLNLRYDPLGPLVLRNVSLIIEASEKIGIVGRTGAGKSTTISALFQLYEIEGRILIDDIDITKIPLEASRQKLSIIPQEPFLFSGTMRTNLDPVGKYTDEFLWWTLEQVELKDYFSEDPKGLDTPVTEGGLNFSTGQRQLVCLARALTRNNKIIIMDEATANVDPYTDALILKTIRTRFSECTVVTVAHRLQTVMDSDKILVMRAGKVEEYDHPFVLLNDIDGYLYQLVKANGENTFSALKAVAKSNYEKKYGARYIDVKPVNET